MPKPPENGVYGPVRGHRPPSAAGEYPRPTASLPSEIDSSQVTVSGTNVKSFVTVFMTCPAATITQDSMQMSALPPVATDFGWSPHIRFSPDNDNCAVPH